MKSVVMIVVGLLLVAGLAAGSVEQFSRPQPVATGITPQVAPADGNGPMTMYLPVGKAP